MQQNDLIRKLQSKDQKAFETIYHLYSESIFGIMNSS